MQADALIADGHLRDLGAVAGVTRVANPVGLARCILDDPWHCLFVGPDAERYAVERGIALTDNAALRTPEMEKRHRLGRIEGSHDTVGAIALDRQGYLAVAASTSGTPRKPPGRVGDTAVWGAGAFAEDGIGAIAVTGQGEDILRERVATVAAAELTGGRTAAEAATATAKVYAQRRTGSWMGLIVLDAEGRIGVAKTAPRLAWGWVIADGHISCGIENREEC